MQEVSDHQILCLSTS